MAAPATPTTFNVQQGNGQVYLTWDLMAGATSYSVQRSTDGVTYTVISTPGTNSYLNTSVTVGTNYFYKVASINIDGTSPYTTPQSSTPTFQGEMTLGQIRLASQQRADRVNSQFVGFTEWNSYINQSAFELYDLLITLYEDYFVSPPFIFQTTGLTGQYPLPNGTLTDYQGNPFPPFYKLMGVDLGLSSSVDSYVTLKKFEFISRNRYVYPQLTSTYLGVFNLRYRLVGSNLFFIPNPSAGQFIRVWYIPRLNQLIKDTDLLDGVSGWTEYVIVDAAIKALQKEESDTSLLVFQKQALIKRIEESAMNRDAGQPDTVSDTRNFNERWGYNGYPNGPIGGF